MAHFAYKETKLCLVSVHPPTSGQGSPSSLTSTIGHYGQRCGAKEGIPDSYIEAVASVMANADWHTYQVLTKRSKRLTKLLSTRLRFAASARHIWWGVSVEDKRYGLARMPDLQSAPATVRFLSIEPLLEDLGSLELRGIHWVIVGGESGRSARPMKREWALSIRDQCLAA